MAKKGKSKKKKLILFLEQHKKTTIKTKYVKEKNRKYAREQQVKALWLVGWVL